MREKKYLSWNVNGIRAIEKKGFLGWLKKESPDILAVQETKASPGQLSESLLKPGGYETFWSSAERKGYSGVACFVKEKPIAVSYGLGKKEFDAEGRVLILEYGAYFFINCYFPNGQNGNVRVPYKLKFYDAFLKKMCQLKKKTGKALIICGDVNTAHAAIDLARPKENEKNTGFLPEERAWIDALLAAGFTDSFRAFVSEGGWYTWWDYKTRARERNSGWRLDYFFIDTPSKKCLTDAFIYTKVQGSDHCPVGIRVNM